MARAEAEALLDRALDVANRELALLEEGEVDEAAVLAEDRSKLIERAWNSGTLDELKPLRDKLVQLQSMQNRLTDEARKLHARIREELKRSRQETKRHAGYGSAMRTAPLITSALSRRG